VHGLPDDPLERFRAWHRERDHDFVALATASASGRPSVRMVGLEWFDGLGFGFYTGVESRKGRELAENPQAALCFFWEDAGRQVRVEGTVERAELDPRQEALAQASDAKQDEPVRDRAEAEARVAELRARYGEGADPVPADWGAYRLVPDAYEFWEYREDKLHDRFRYRRDGDGWAVDRLFP
jgi:pyridoxamine 5'-phosphate oxidase